ncbi:MAG: hypothetical protein HKN67_11520 [Saprospiraceae bacterium]|nr:hypothetical protein [Saprospiraceae bacterium]
MELSMAQGISALLVIVGLIGIIKLSSSGKKPDYTIPGMENFENKT